MKGVLFNILEALIRERFGDEMLATVHADTEFISAAPPFLGPDSYPDEDLFTMLGVLSEKTSVSVHDLLFEFGKSMFPILARTYPAFLEGHDKPLEFLSQVNEVIHMEVRKILKDSSPPEITLGEVMGGQTRIHYRSKRNLCRLVEGLLVGVAKHFGKKVVYQQEQCVHEGAKSCVFLVSFY